MIAGGTGQPTGIYEKCPLDGPVVLQQGEILSGFVQQFLNTNGLADGELQVDEMLHPFVIVMSQSCDREWDAHARLPGGEPDKVLPHVLVCEALTAEEVRARRNVKGETINNSKLWPRIRTNKDERFHFFQRVPSYEDAVGAGVGELVVDFKRYFSVPTPELYWKLTQKTKRRARLRTPYLEHFATRFFQYQARIATPRQHLSD